jgi:dimethylargininase
MTLPTPTRALVRPFPATYAPSYRTRGIEIAPARAAQQHRAYARALEHAGLRVETLSTDEAFYDCVFVEDTAVVWGRAVLIGALGRPDRQGEQGAVMEWLARTHTVIDLPPGATLEGGDVMHTDEVTYVGLSARTNTAGANALRDFMMGVGRPVVTVPVTNALHLKTAATYLGNGTVIAADGCIDLDRFKDLSVIKTPPGEPGAANCLRIGETLLIPAGYPASERALKVFASAHQLHVEALDISEFEKGGGSLSCLSLRWRDD